MPSKKKKYNARFPPARIKKIMQSDEEVGKVAQVVPIIISKSLEIFVEQLLSASSEVTRGRNARTLTPTHIKNAILAKPEFSFLREVAQQIPDVSSAMEDGGDGEDSGGGGNGTTTGNNLAPVDFSMRGGGGGTSSSNSNNRIASTSTTAAATSLATTIHQPGVLNLSSSNSQVQYPQYPIQSPTVPQPPTPRPRGRPRKRPLPEQLELQQQSQQPPFVPLGGGGLVQSPGPKKMANSRVSFSPVALIHGKMPPLGGNVGHHQHPLAVMSPSSSSSAASMLLGSGVPPPAHHNPTTSTKVPPSPSATSSSLEALTSVIASVSQPVLKHRPYLNTTTTTSTTPSSLISPSIPSATITRPSSIVQQQQHQQPKTIPIKSNTEHQPNSDYDSTDYDTNGHGEEEEDDEDEDEDDDDETEEDDEDDEAEMAVANLSTSNNNPTMMTTATQQRAQRTSVLVANPIVSSIKLSAPGGGDEDDDYDNI